jgi:hypothetical protein
MDPTLDLPESDTPALDAWLRLGPFRSVWIERVRNGVYNAVAREVYEPMFFATASSPTLALVRLSERLERV